MADHPTPLHPQPRMQASVQLAGASGEWLSISAAARALGVSRSAVQQRAKRGTIPTREDNRGNPQVYVEEGATVAGDSLQQVADATPCKSQVQVADATPQAADDVLAVENEGLRRLVEEQAAHIETLKAGIERAELREQRAWERQMTLALELAEARSKRRWWRVW